MVLPDPLGDSTTEAAAARSSDNGALVVLRKRQGFRSHQRKEKRVHEGVCTYADTVCGCFTALRKRAALAAASSRLVAAVEALDFFGRLPKRPEAARHFCAPPPAAGTMDEPAP